MVRALFLVSDAGYTAFSVRGHASDTARAGEDILCAAISSAVYLTANTATDICGAKADICTADGRFRFSLSDTNRAAESLLKGLCLHLSALARQYPNELKVRIINISHITEVRDHA